MIRLYPGDPTPTGTHIRDDDWFRYYGPKPGDIDGTTHYEVHEMGCIQSSCAYRPNEPCPWHPKGCDCSDGQCQV